jgi:valyl-tRNA synthetase
MNEYEFEESRFKNTEIEGQFHDFQVVLGALRETRTSKGIPFNQQIPFSTGCDAETASVLQTMTNTFVQMANAIPVAWGPSVVSPPLSVTRVVQGVRGALEVHADVSKYVDVEAERKRLEKERENLTKFLKSIDAKLANAAFVDKAPADVVQQQRDKRAELAAQLESVAAALAKLNK